MPTRNARAVWEGSLKEGRGNFTADSGAISGQYSFGSRFESGTGSNPEELLAAAEAACYSMALSGGLTTNGTPPTKIETAAACTVEKTDAGNTITRIALTVRASVPNVDAATFQQIASRTKETCPVSRAFKGNVDITVDAKLV